MGGEFAGNSGPVEAGKFQPEKGLNGGAVKALNQKQQARKRMESEQFQRNLSDSKGKLKKNPRQRMRDLGRIKRETHGMKPKLGKMKGETHEMKGDIGKSKPDIGESKRVLKCI